MVRSAVALPTDAPDLQSRPAAERFMRSLLRIDDRSRRVRESAVQRMFSTSMLLSATRCLITYVVIPFLAPVLGVSGTVGPVLGIVVGIPALAYDVIGMRRFWLADHRLRWPFTFIYLAVMVLVVILVVGDASRLAR